MFASQVFPSEFLEASVIYGTKSRIDRHPSYGESESGPTGRGHVGLLQESVFQPAGLKAECRPVILGAVLKDLCDHAESSGKRGSHRLT